MDRAVPLGLIINELVTNSLKHAFPQGQAGVIGIELRALDRQAIQLCVRDTGVGLPSGFDPLSGTSLGMQIVSLLTEQLSGTLMWMSTPGAYFVLTIP
jgi:two-component sensor histidine kinase